MPPLLKVVLVLLWLVSGLVGFFTGPAIAEAVLAAIGLGSAWVTPIVWITCLIDLAIAALILFDRRGNRATMIQIAVIAFYTIALTIALPQLWLDPLGSLVKNLPILAAVLCYGAMSDPR
jgi:hypothetical protein